MEEGVVEAAWSIATCQAPGWPSLFLTRALPSSLFGQKRTNQG